nr:MAG TPA: hypothetical protein [Caudoviricetes sp.]
MNDKELLAALGRLKVETGSLACMECGYERSCGVHGCAVLRAAEERLRELLRPSSSASAPAGAEKQTAQDMVTAAAALRAYLENREMPATVYAAICVAIRRLEGPETTDRPHSVMEYKNRNSERGKT